MDLNDYQSQIRQHINYPTEVGPYSVILALMKDVGHLSEKLDDVLINDHGSFDDKKRLSTGITIGDILFDIVNLASDLNYSLNEIAAINLMKHNKESENKDKSKKEETKE